MTEVTLIFLNCKPLSTYLFNMPNASLIGVLRGVGKFTLKHSSVVYRAYWRNKCALRFIFAPGG